MFTCPKRELSMYFYTIMLLQDFFLTFCVSSSIDIVTVSRKMTDSSGCGWQDSSGQVQFVFFFLLSIVWQVCFIRSNKTTSVCHHCQYYHIWRKYWELRCTKNSIVHIIQSWKNWMRGLSLFWHLWLLIADVFGTVSTIWDVVEI